MKEYDCSLFTVKGADSFPSLPIFVRFGFGFGFAIEISFCI